MAYNEATTANAPPKPVTASSAVEDFDPVIGRLEQLAERASTCGDRVTGVRPREVSGVDKSPAPGHLISSIQTRRERLMRVADHLEHEMQRIETGIG